MTTRFIHTINNQLTIIRGYSELLRQRLRPGDALAEMVEEIRRAADQIAELCREPMPVTQPGKVS